MDFVKAEVVILKDFQNQGEDLVLNMFEEYGISGAGIASSISLFIVSILIFIFIYLYISKSTH